MTALKKRTAATKPAKKSTKTVARKPQVVKTKVLPTDASVYALAQLMAQSLEDGKAEDVKMLCVAGLCGFCDYILIAHGNSDRQVQALADRIDKDVTTKLRRKPLGVEGRKEGQWILMDYGDVVVHLFLEELRSFYALESMWHDAPLEAIGSVTKKPAARKTRKDL